MITTGKHLKWNRWFFASRNNTYNKRYVNSDPIINIQKNEILDFQELVHLLGWGMNHLADKPILDLYNLKLAQHEGQTPPLSKTVKPSKEIKHKISENMADSW